MLEYSSNYADITGSVWFYTKDESTNFNNYVTNTDNFKSFKHKAKLFGNTVADGNNGIIKNATIVEPLKYLSNFWRLLEMLLFNCKVELARIWTKRCVSSVLGNDTDNDTDNDNADFNNIIFTIKDTKLYFSVATLSAKDNQKLLVYRNECKTKVRIKIQQTSQCRSEWGGRGGGPWPPKKFCQAAKVLFLWLSKYFDWKDT